MIAPHRPTADELRAWREFLQAYHRVIRRLDAEMQVEHGLALGAYEVLHRLSLARGNCMKMNDLARVVLLSPSGLSRLVDRLVRRGLVERLPAPDDARAIHAHLTPGGRQVFRLAARTHGRGLREHFAAGLSPAQLAQLSCSLRAVCVADPKASTAP